MTQQEKWTDYAHASAIICDLKLHKKLVLHDDYRSF